MSRRSLFLSMGAGLLVAALTLSLSAWWLFGAGSVQVQIHGDDMPRISFGLPLSLIQAGLILTPDVVFAELRHELDDELGPWLTSFEAFCDGLEDCPDGVFVQVESDDEQVLVVKKRRHIQIQVIDGDENVKVKVPIKAIRLFGRQLAEG
jgi:hypothetical protein